MSLLNYVLIGLASIAGGAVNALAGGGTLITFPMLTAVGIPAVAANVTNTVALCPGYLGAAFAQSSDFLGQKRRLKFLVPVSVLGGLGGGFLLLHTPGKTFRSLVPFLILFATGLLAFQDVIRRWLVDRSAHRGGKPHEAWIILAVIPAAVYGGYFGAGVSVIVLAVLGIVLNDSLTRLNALKQIISFSCNIAAAIFFSFLRKGRLAGGSSHGHRRHNRRCPGRQACGKDKTIGAEKDRRDYRDCCGSDLSGAVA